MPSVGWWSGGGGGGVHLHCFDGLIALLIE